MINVAVQVLAASLHPGGQQAALPTPIAGFLSSLSHCSLEGITTGGVGPPGKGILEICGNTAGCITQQSDVWE